MSSLGYYVTPWARRWHTAALQAYAEPLFATLWHIVPLAFWMTYGGWYV